MKKMSLTNGNRTSKASPKRTYTRRSEPADWAGVDSQALITAVAALGSIGGALRLGYTRDGGAYAIGIYGLEAEPYTDYLRPGDDISAYLYGLADTARHAGPPVDVVEKLIKAAETA